MTQRDEIQSLKAVAAKAIEENEEADRVWKGRASFDFIAKFSPYQVWDLLDRLDRSMELCVDDRGYHDMRVIELPDESFDITVCDDCHIANQVEK